MDLRIHRRSKSIPRHILSQTGSKIINRQLDKLYKRFTMKNMLLFTIISSFIDISLVNTRSFVTLEHKSFPNALQLNRIIEITAARPHMFHLDQKMMLESLIAL